MSDHVATSAGLPPLRFQVELIYGTHGLFPNNSIFGSHPIDDGWRTKIGLSTRQRLPQINLKHRSIFVISTEAVLTPLLFLVSTGFGCAPAACSFLPSVAHPKLT